MKHTIYIFSPKAEGKYEGYMHYVAGKGRSSDFVCCRNMSEYILRKVKNLKQTKNSVVSIAVGMIKEEIRKMDFQKECYPGWHGYMQSVHNFKVEERSNIELLPLIDHNPNTDECVY